MGGDQDPGRVGPHAHEVRAEPPATAEACSSRPAPTAPATDTDDDRRAPSTGAPCHGEVPSEPCVLPSGCDATRCRSSRRYRRRNSCASRAVGQDMTTIGFIGAGHIGGTARAARGRRTATTSSSATPAAPRPSPTSSHELGDRARAGTAADAAAAGDVVVVTIPLKASPTSRSSRWPARSSSTPTTTTRSATARSPSWTTSRRRVSELLQRHLPTSQVVKAFNNITSGDLAAGRPGRRPGPPRAGDRRRRRRREEPRRRAARRDRLRRRRRRPARGELAHPARHRRLRPAVRRRPAARRAGPGRALPRHVTPGLALTGW